ncbi:MAG TPA: L,D-transpeptidase family protein [Smithella sp.]|nr:L,D-transpeptidase family protein [Smithella sp.]HOU50024.1 L,D-transpeptidase family protein [Smithella sp.]HQG64974.1 L,D-transpeptidase family protein [Smithella sp.]HQH15958.1 L,D-transpeptidase family protein [Smithella sp.]HQI72072.1 L,D-transpeptidase family protein [Smithella sp.]
MLIPFGVRFDAGNFLNLHKNAIGNAYQILLVTDENFLFFHRPKLYAMEKKGDTWESVFESIHAVAGRNGFAAAGEKKEGDGKTPSGIFPLKTTFGYPASVKTKMPYRQSLEDDIWVDDVNADDYNRWGKKQETLAASFEMMKRDDDQYKYGIVIEYNTDPVIRGNGSAIFLHIWKCPGLPTAGCVAVSEENILKILQWLDPAASPLIITGIKN